MRRALLLLLLLLPAAGCAARHRPLPKTLPADFAVELLVEPTGETGPEAPWRSQRLVLTIDRRLRRIVGSRAPRMTHPPTVARLRREDLQTLYEHIRSHQLIAEPTSPLAEDEAALPSPSEAGARITVRLELAGHHHTYRTTNVESPPTTRLLALIHEAAGLAR